MGQKVNPIAFRLAVNKDWRSKWFATGKDYTTKLHEDLSIRSYLKRRLQTAALAKVVIERAWNSVRVTLHTSRPGLIIGRQGRDIEIMTRYRLESLMLGFNTELFPSSKFNLVKLQQEILEHFLYGLATLKGYKLILKYKQQRLNK